MDLKAVLETIWSLGTRSVLVEGGGKTLSFFLARGQTDLLHPHIAPLLLGSGLLSFQLSPVARIQEGTYFHATHFYLDKEILLKCLPRHRPILLGRNAWERCYSPGSDFFAGTGRSQRHRNLANRNQPWNRAISRVREGTPEMLVSHGLSRYGGIIRTASQIRILSRRPSLNGRYADQLVFAMCPH